MQIRLDPISDPDVLALLEEHAALMETWSPPGACHYFNADALRQSDVTFWTIWDGEALVGCGALKDMGGEGEIKSMNVRGAHRGKGAGRIMLEHVLKEAQRRGYDVLSLETGPQDGFAAARRLYETYGFEYCGPFGDYAPNNNSVFMRLDMAKLVSPSAEPR